MLQIQHSELSVQDQQKARLIPFHQLNVLQECSCTGQSPQEAYGMLSLCCSPLQLQQSAVYVHC